MVVLLHAYEGWCGWYGHPGILTHGTYKDFSTGGKYVDQLMKNLGIGVDIFFLLSGFLITYILLEEKKKYQKINIGKFMIRRTLRIWPLYFLLVILSPLIVSWLDSTPTPNYLANIFFVGNFDIIHIERWVYPFSHFWSICIEEHFYLVWPFLIAFVPKKHLLSLFSMIIIGSIAFRVYSCYSLVYPWYTLFLHTLSRIDVLVIGALGALFYSEKPYAFALPRVVRFSLFAILVFALSLESVSLWDSILMAGFKKYFYIGIISVLLLDYNFNSTRKHRLPKNSWIHYFGRVSYGIYMYSNIILLIVIKKIMWENQITNIWVFFGLVISLSILIPIISYELFEKHFLKISKRFRIINVGR